MLTVTVPADASAGPDKKVVVSPRGATAPAQATIEIVQEAVSAVEPSPLGWSPGALITVKGAGFGSKQGTLSVAGTSDVHVIDWDDTQVRATLPDTLGALPAGQQRAELTVPGRTEPLAYPVTLSGLTMTPTAVQPTPVPLRPGMAITITGTGFGPHPPPTDEPKVTLGEVELKPASWNDGAVVATLPDTVGAVSDRAGSRMELTVERLGRTAESLAVEVTLPATTIASFTPNPVTVRPGERAFIVGSGFGGEADPARPQVVLGTMELNVASRTDTLLVVELLADADAVAAGMSEAASTEQLIVRREGWKEALTPIGLKRPTPVPGVPAATSSPPGVQPASTTPAPG